MKLGEVYKITIYGLMEHQQTMSLGEPIHLAVIDCIRLDRISFVNKELISQGDILSTKEFKKYYTSEAKCPRLEPFSGYRIGNAMYMLVNEDELVPLTIEGGPNEIASV